MHNHTLGNYDIRSIKEGKREGDRQNDPPAVKIAALKQTEKRVAQQRLNYSKYSVYFSDVAVHTPFKMHPL